jgi:hypothetical protein
VQPDLDAERDGPVLDDGPRRPLGVGVGEVQQLARIALDAVLGEVDERQHSRPALLLDVASKPGEVDRAG